ncbi:MAG: type I DNA topoisomerase [Oscillospiraceae bacterium]|nr:type I DNA topoisomerase [Oscillospiraceae bacterium]
MENLVIVESPAKAKTIAKYLGSGYQVKASMGHIRDLPKKTLGVDVDHDFALEYVPIDGKDDIIRELKAAAEKSDTVFLATDPDREGEAISWHLAKLLDLDEKTANRVTFNEITKRAVSEGISNPRTIDLNLVDAQQARRALDRLVGYKISPFLWKKVRRGLSAGRVQSVVTRMVVDREREIRAFKPEEYWSLDAFLLHAAAKRPFVAHYYGANGKKAKLTNEAQTQALIDEIKKGEFIVKSVKLGERRQKAHPPYTTSTLQQDASHRLNMPSKRTMSVAQTLYEGVSLAGRGLTGLITYMRTDSVRIAPEAVSAVRDFIGANYGPSFLPKSPAVYTTKSGAQDAHEAIRPSDVTITPDSIRGDLDAGQYKLYKLIWERFVASQMAPAVFNTISADIENGVHLFKASSQSVKFKGYMALYPEKDDEEEKKDAPVPVGLAAGEKLTLSELKPEQHFTQPPPRYNEASLIKEMEEKGIGRPSTYAPTISTILDRDYIEREKKALKPTPLGEAVTDLMIDNFSDIVNVKFTAAMEDKLDRVEEGEDRWQSVLSEFYSGLSQELKQAEAQTTQRVRVAGEPTDEICEKCGKPMEIRSGRYGKYLACTGYPECTNRRPLKKTQDEVSDQICEKCGKPMLIKSGAYGRFLACSGYPECKNTKPLDGFTDGICPLCGGRIIERRSKRGFKFFSCENAPECKFITWDTPLADKCPKCGKTLFRHSYKGEKWVGCLDEKCGYKKEEEKTAGKAKKA